MHACGAPPHAYGMHTLPFYLSSIWHACFNLLLYFTWDAIFIIVSGELHVDTQGGSDKVWDCAITAP